VASTKRKTYCHSQRQKHKDMKVAQILFHTIPKIEMVTVNELDTTERAGSGFDSTGTH